MKAIVAKYYGPSNIKGSRIKVSAEGVSSKWYGYDYSENDGGKEVYIKEFAEAHGWSGDIAFGEHPDGSTIGVFK